MSTNKNKGENGELGAAAWLADACRELQRARAKADRASLRRQELPAGSSRARVTTANAKWAIACKAAERARGEVLLRMVEMAEVLGWDMSEEVVCARRKKVTEGA